jgi:acyl carrier protein
VNDPIVESVMEGIRAVFENKRQTAPALAPDTRLDASLGLKSLDYAELVVRLEGVFGFDPFAGGLPPRIDTIADLAALYRRS